MKQVAYFDKGKLPLAPIGGDRGGFEIDFRLPGGMVPEEIRFGYIAGLAFRRPRIGCDIAADSDTASSVDWFEVGGGVVHLGPREPTVVGQTFTIELALLPDDAEGPARPPQWVRGCIIGRRQEPTARALDPRGVAYGMTARASGGAGMIVDAGSVREALGRCAECGRRKK